MALAIVVAGSVVQAKAALSGTLWTDEEGFLSRMVAGQYFSISKPKLTSGGGAGYTYAGELINNGADVLLTFYGSPTGVGGYFNPGTVLTFTFVGNLSQSPLQVVVGESRFIGYTTDVNPGDLAISTLRFSVDSPPSKIIAGLDVVIPEPTTILAGALLILPFAASTACRRRKRV